MPPLPSGPRDGRHHAQILRRRAAPSARRRLGVRAGAREDRQPARARSQRLRRSLRRAPDGRIRVSRGADPAQARRRVPELHEPPARDGLPRLSGAHAVDDRGGARARSAGRQPRRRLPGRARHAPDEPARCERGDPLHLPHQAPRRALAGSPRRGPLHHGLDASPVTASGAGATSRPPFICAWKPSARRLSSSWRSTICRST